MMLFLRVIGWSQMLLAVFYAGAGEAEPAKTSAILAVALFLWAYVLEGRK